MPDGLNPAQREAVHTLSGPLLVLAGAGTGKTRVVTFRIARLIDSGVPPARILAVTFTNKAATEMQERAGKLLGKRPAAKPEISTFHSLCVRILRRHATRLGYPAAFAIYDRGDQESVARAALRDIRVGAELLRPSDLIYHISRWKSASVSPQQASSHAANDKEHLAAAAYRRYQQSLKLAGAMDFDDLLTCTEQLFAEHPAARNQEAARFAHLLIDEYQDTNGSQYRIVRALAAGHRNLCVVGDDDQSIYGWRGAEVAHILRFKHDWPDAKVVRLEENYRSTAEILALANRLIAFNKTRHDKVLRAARPGGEKPQIRQFQDETAEAKGVVEDLQARLTQPGVQPRDFAILFRTNEQPRPFETELRRLKLPYVLVGGMSFFDRKEVRDIVAYLKILALPQDEVSLLRIINTPPRGIGQKAVEALLAQAVGRGEPLWEVLGHAGDCEGVAPAAAAAVGEFRKLIEQFRARLERHESLVEITSQLIDQVGYQDELARLYKEPADQQARWQAVEEVVNAVGGFEKRGGKSLKAFLDDIALGNRDDDEKESQLARNAIALMTLHSAKGLEFSQVYLVGLEEGVLPHHRSVAGNDAAIDEERRLCYVGVTRAQDRLTMSLPLSRMKWGKPRPTVPSRFLFELTGQADSPAAVAARSGRSAHAMKPSGGGSAKKESGRTAPAKRRSK